MIGATHLHVSAKEHAPELRAARQKAGLSQAQLATTLGVSRRTISRWETGHGNFHRIWLARIRALGENGRVEATNALKQVSA